MPDDNDDELINCSECSSEISQDDSFTANNGEIICNDCVQVCQYCESIYTSNDDWYNVGNESWCESCWSNDSFTCNRCDFCTNSNRDGGTNVGNEYWCEDCVSDNATYCDECDEYYPEHDTCSCSQSASGTIHQYSYKPNPVFHGGNDKNLYMGFELEMSFGDDPDRGDYNTAISDVLELEQADVCYLKQDGSIGGWGYELVTHPHTLHAYENATPLWNYLERLRDNYGARSWDTDSCGLHVHVSRSAFKSGAHTHRFLSLIYRNPREMMKLAGRKNSRFARFDDVYKPDEWGIPQFNLRDKVHGGFSERYSAVNTNNEYTLELRFFRGNMKREGIMSALELCHASVEYTRNLSVPDVKLGMLKWEWFADGVATNNGLYPNLYQRMSKVPSISLSTPTLINA